MLVVRKISGDKPVHRDGEWLGEFGSLYAAREYCSYYLRANGKVGYASIQTGGVDWPGDVGPVALVMGGNEPDDPEEITLSVDWEG